MMMMMMMMMRLGERRGDNDDDDDDEAAVTETVEAGRMQRLIEGDWRILARVWCPATTQGRNSLGATH